MQAEKKIAAVTGAGTGIGQAAAVALAQAGFSVALLGRRIDPLLATQEIIELAGGVAAAIPTDVSDETSVDASFSVPREKALNRPAPMAPGLPMPR